MEKRIRKPLAIGDILSIYGRPMGLSRRMNEQRLLDAWEEAVGEGVAKRTEPMRIENRVLFLKVANSVWMQQLQFMKELILKKLHEKTGINFLQDLRFFIGEVDNLDRGRRRQSPKRDLPPLSESDTQNIAREVSGVEDPEMKKILADLYSRALAVERNRTSEGNINKL